MNIVIVSLFFCTNFVGGSHLILHFQLLSSEFTECSIFFYLLLAFIFLQHKFNNETTKKEKKNKTQTKNIHKNRVLCIYFSLFFFVFLYFFLRTSYDYCYYFYFRQSMFVSVCCGMKKSHIHKINSKPKLFLVVFHVRIKREIHTNK